MVKDVFGSPGAHDSTAEWDKLVEEAAQEHAEMFKVARDDILNRQVGSKRVPMQQRQDEWEIMRVTPVMLTDFLKSQNATVEEAVNHIFEMEEKRT